MRLRNKGRYLLKGFRRDIAWSPTRTELLVDEAEVYDHWAEPLVDRAVLLLNHDVVWLEVPVDYIDGVQELDSLEETSEEVAPMQVCYFDLLASHQPLEVPAIEARHQHRLMVEELDLWHNRLQDAVENHISFLSALKLVDCVQASDLLLEASADHPLALLLQFHRHLDTEKAPGVSGPARLVCHSEAATTHPRTQL